MDTTTPLYDYYLQQGINPSWDFSPWVPFPLYAVALIATLLVTLWSRAKHKDNAHWYLLIFLPFGALSLFHFTPLLLSLPILYIAHRLLPRYPVVSAAIVSVGAILLLHPLLGYFYIFFTRDRKRFGFTALVVTGGMLLLPLLWQSLDSLEGYVEWYKGFRSSPTAEQLPSEYSALHLMRRGVSLHPMVDKLIVVNLFHILLLPCIRSRKISQEAREVLLSLFAALLLLFVGVFSALNTPATVLIPAAGTWIWMRETQLLPRLYSYLLGWGSIVLSSIPALLFSLGHPVELWMECVGILPYLVVWGIGVVELWKRTSRPKLLTSHHR